MHYVSKTFKAGVAVGRDLVLSEDLLDLLADRIASRVAARLRERPSTPTHRQGRAAPAAPAVPELRADRLYRVAEASKMLGVCKATVYNLARDGRLELVKVGARASGVTGTSLIALIKQNRAP
ncbi:helix-turn-helix domain-containing protein [Burkholderia cenocepacia]|uniref:helix-turn-helix transcriptional regulator n=1 Tax=Burkholderia cepacia complex TaxID=87882 RepID=UPI001B9F4D9D|nr:helix-turn-helix domain-containing protein [Burkholderia cenocepacia]MBR8278126.1 helix-turn-helix domain-containing protein [Burkholderia cenocepacia]